MKYFIQTLGCAMNYSDSERVSAVLENMGYTKADVPEDSDLYIFNTCSIRQKGEDRVYGQLRTLGVLKKANPRLLVGITGCMVRTSSSRNSEKERKDELLRRLGTLDFVFRITDTPKLGEILEEAEPRLELPEFSGADVNDYLTIKPQYTSHFQAFVPIQIGCDKYCTYCIVPYSRGREKSRMMKDIFAECEALVERGCKEITLVGQTVNSYGKSFLDKKNGQWEQFEDPFVALLEQIDRLHAKGLDRLRFTSPHPRDYTDTLIQAHARLKTLTPHFHLPVQAGDNETLKKMNRQYTVEHYEELVRKIRAALPEASITTDIIVGFCGETAEQFENTSRLFERVRWDMAYLARYSPRPGTTSFMAWKDDVPREEKARRWHRLNDILEQCSLDYHRNMEGKTVRVLVEKFDEKTGECEGKNRENKVVQFQGSPEFVGTIVPVRITKGLQWLAKGELIQLTINN